MIHLILNSPYLGGAERSAIEQAAMAFEYNSIQFHIPRTHSNEHSTQMHEFIQSKFPIANISFFPYQSQLFQVSRTSLISQLVGLFFIPLAIFKIFHYRMTMKLGEGDILWLNGNKAAVLFILSLLFKSSSAKWIWHWRDYPSTSGLLSLIKKLLKFKSPRHLLLLANSQSVEKSLNLWKPTDSIKTDYVYNPSGSIPFRKRDEIKVIGIASMLAPWKGQHDILLNLAINKDKLIHLGIESCFIFGDEIYQTSGEHFGYKLQLEKLIKKFNLESFVYLKGNSDPVSIYQQIDLMIHSSLFAEPFGRVLIESFAAGIPVLSTGLGGAREVIGLQNERAWTYQISHPEDFFQQISTIVTLENSRKVIEKAHRWSEQQNQQILVKLRSLFKN